MTIKSILLPVDEPPRLARAAGLALPLAKRLDARITALQARQLATDQLLYVAEGMIASAADHLIDTIEQEDARRRAQAREALDAVAREHGIKTVEAMPPPGFAIHFRSETGSEAELVATQGRAHDLVVAPWPEGGGPELSPTLHAALFETGRPLLLAPEREQTSVGQCVLLAWNGGVEAARALAAAADLAGAAERIVVLSVDDGAKPGTRGELAAEYLEAHGLNAEVQRATSEGRVVADVLLRQADAIGADLLVMGAYGRSRLRETILGGVTRDILANPELPVLLAH